jgi:A/G-specific adenine glycosylase
MWKLLTVQFADLPVPDNSIRVFRRTLLSWYDQNRRDLPWRRNQDPYGIWVSEVMLQQTRVAAVIDHYQKFLKRFPTVEKLAAAREPSVLAAWSGLGYYRRARMLHAGAKQIVKNCKGKFPESVQKLREISGIGRYTAAAIASIAFGEPAAVVDGNVERVLQRLEGKLMEKEQIWDGAQALLNPQRPGDSNQAFMELGATVCVPRQPLCMLCPILQLCATRGELPTQKKATPQRQREIHYALHRENGSVLLVRRPAQASLMPDMWELPETSSGEGELIFSLRHAITITDYTVRVRQAKIKDGNHGNWIPFAKLPRIPLTGLARKILRKAEIIQ